MRARESGKGVLTAPFKLLKTNRLGVILTFAVYKRDLPPNATPTERVQESAGYAIDFRICGLNLCLNFRMRNPVDILHFFLIGILVVSSISNRL